MESICATAGLEHHDSERIPNEFGFQSGADKIAKSGAAVENESGKLSTARRRGTPKIDDRLRVRTAVKYNRNGVCARRDSLLGASGFRVIVTAQYLFLTVRDATKSTADLEQQNRVGRFSQTLMQAHLKRNRLKGGHEPRLLCEVRN